MTVLLLIFMFISVVLLCDPKRGMYMRALGITIGFYLIMAWIGLMYVGVKWICSLFDDF